MTKNIPEDRQERIERNMGLAVAAASKIMRERNLPEFRREDLIAYAYEGLVDAVDRFDPDKAVNTDPQAALRTFLYKRIYYFCIDALRRETGVRAVNGEAKVTKVQTFSLDAVRDTESGELGLDPGETEPAYAQIEARETVAQILEYLPDQDRWILEEYWLKGRTLQNIADEKGVTESRVGHLSRMALDNALVVAKAHPQMLNEPDQDLPINRLTTHLHKKAGTVPRAVARYQKFGKNVKTARKQYVYNP